MKNQKMNILEMFMMIQRISFLKLAQLSRIPTKRLHEIIDYGSPLKKREMKQISAAIGIDLQKLNAGESKP